MAGPQAELGGISSRLEAGAKAVYLALRNGKRAGVPWEDIGEDHRNQIIRAFVAGLDAWEATA
jgi:hypothetical protein